jgi:hypothetical protein
VQFTSKPRRALGLLAVGTIGMTSAVLGVTGVAQATVPTWTATGSGDTDPVPAGICAIEWTLIGGSGGADSDGAADGLGGELWVTLAVEAGDTFTLYPGTAGADGQAAASGALGGTNGDGIADDQGDAGGLDSDTDIGAGGGGAASTVTWDGDVILGAFGGAGTGVNGGAGGGGTENYVAGLDPAEFEYDPTMTAEDMGDGEIYGEGVPCTPASPYLNYVDEKDGALEVNFVPGEDGDLPTDHFEYTLDEGDTAHTLTGLAERDGRTTATVTGLTNKTEYTVALRAVAANGSASEWTQGETGTPHKKASAPSNVTVATGDGTLTVSWGAATAGSYPITGYTVALVWSNGDSGGGSPFCETGPTVLTCTAPAQPGVTHNVRVQAVDSGQRTGEYAEVTSGVVPASSTLPESDGDLELPAGATSEVPAGKTITVTGSGYAPNSTVTVLIYSQPRILTTVVADVNGNFTVTVTVPADLAPGQHTLVASGVDTMGNLRFVTLPVTVTGLAYTGADIAVPAIGGLAALTAGGALIFVARRRKVS